MIKIYSANKDTPIDQKLYIIQMLKILCIQPAITL